MHHSTKMIPLFEALVTMALISHLYQFSCPIRLLSNVNSIYSSGSILENLVASYQRLTVLSVWSRPPTNFLNFYFKFITVLRI